MKRELHVGRALLLLATCGVGVFFWESPWLLPFKLLAVMGHEMGHETGHALATLLVGGSVERVTLSLNESGACLSRTPDSFFAQVIVYSAGYVGSALISVALLIATFRFNARRVMLTLAAVWLAVMGVFSARDGFTIVFAFVMAVAFAVGSRVLPDSVVGAVNGFIASFTALYAAMDLKDDLWNSAVRAQSDAALLASITWVPAIIWAALWTVLSVAVLLTGAWYALRDEPRATPLEFAPRARSASR